MKNSLNSAVLILLALIIVTGCLSGCKEKDFPGPDKIIVVYNSKLQSTNAIQFMDTVYIGVNYLDPDTVHTVTLYSAGGGIISQATVIRKMKKHGIPRLK